MLQSFVFPRETETAAATEVTAKKGPIPSLVDGGAVDLFFLLFINVGWFSLCLGHGLIGVYVQLKPWGIVWICFVFVVFRLN